MHFFTDVTVANGMLETENYTAPYCDSTIRCMFCFSQLAIELKETGDRYKLTKVFKTETEVTNITQVKLFSLKIFQGNN